MGGRSIPTAFTFGPMSPAQRVASGIASLAADILGEPLRQAAEEQRQFLNSPSSRRIDLEVLTVLLSTAVLLSLRYYCFPSQIPGWLDRFVSAIPFPELGSAWSETVHAPENRQLAGLLYWGLGQFLCYALAPLAIIKLWLRKPLADYGVKAKGALACWQVYLAMFAGLAPLVLLASRRDSFLETYPFYRLPESEPLWPRFYIWQACYAVQFLSLEFFFRGFLLHGCRRRFGPYAVLVMTVPYCMIHFGKPLPETLAAILAGLALGLMSLKTRSIWMGAALHIAVAWTMDFAALTR